MIVKKLYICVISNNVMIKYIMLIIKKKIEML